MAEGKKGRTSSGMEIEICIERMNGMRKYRMREGQKERKKETDKEWRNHFEWKERVV